MCTCGQPWTMAQITQFDRVGGRETRAPWLLAAFLDRCSHAFRIQHILCSHRHVCAIGNASRPQVAFGCLFIPVTPLAGPGPNNILNQERVCVSWDQANIRLVFGLFFCGYSYHPVAMAIAIANMGRRIFWGRKGRSYVEPHHGQPGHHAGSGGRRCPMWTSQIMHVQQMVCMTESVGILEGGC